MKGLTAFHLEPALAVLRDTYPPSESVLEAAASGSREQAVIARLWISEGTPFAFRECPALYEEARSWLAKQLGLGLDPKAISLRGSGRLGYSLTPEPKKWGVAYCPRCSDLDLFAVSERLFAKLREESKCWMSDYDSGATVPNSAKERKHWPENRECLPRNIQSGFVDAWKVPNRRNYPVVSRTNDCLARLQAKLQMTDVVPTPRKKLTLRCYEDWQAYEKQAVRNLRAAASLCRKQAS